MSFRKMDHRPYRFRSWGRGGLILLSRKHLSAKAPSMIQEPWEWSFRFCEISALSLRAPCPRRHSKTALSHFCERRETQAAYSRNIARKARSPIENAPLRAEEERCLPKSQLFSQTKRWPTSFQETRTGHLKQRRCHRASRDPGKGSCSNAHHSRRHPRCA